MNGSITAIVTPGPTPGSTPTTMPITEPTTMATTTGQVPMVEKPCARLLMKSISAPQGSRPCPKATFSTSTNTSHMPTVRGTAISRSSRSRKPSAQPVSDTNSSVQVA